MIGEEGDSWEAMDGGPDAEQAFEDHADEYDLNDPFIDDDSGRR